MSKFADLSGKRFGKLTALTLCGKDGNNGMLWSCSCECGGTSVVRAAKLVSGATKSCGCLKTSRNLAENRRTKQCPQCVREGRISPLPVSDFYRGENYSGGISSLCKSCSKNYRMIPPLERSSSNAHVIRRGNANTYLELRGERFGALVVVQYVGGTGNGSVWECRCNCGTVLELTRNVLMAKARRGAVISCGCLSTNKSKNKNCSAFRTLLYRYKNGAKSRGYVFDLTEEQFSLVTGHNCFYCGVKPMQECVYRGEVYLYNGIDRIDNSRGYVWENCRPCCKQCNIAKGIMSEDDFLSWLDAVRDQSRKPPNWPIGQEHIIRDGYVSRWKGKLSDIYTAKEITVYKF